MCLAGTSDTQFDWPLLDIFQARKLCNHHYCTLWIKTTAHASSAEQNMKNSQLVALETKRVMRVSVCACADSVCT